MEKTYTYTVSAEETVTAEVEIDVRASSREEADARLAELLKERDNPLDSALRDNFDELLDHNELEYEIDGVEEDEDGEDDE